MNKINKIPIAPTATERGPQTLDRDGLQVLAEPAPPQLGLAVV
jgi:hypothetical protein